MKCQYVFGGSCKYLPSGVGESHKEVTEITFSTGRGFIFNLSRVIKLTCIDVLVCDGHGVKELYIEVWLGC